MKILFPLIIMIQSGHKFCTRHDSSAVMPCAKLWSDLAIFSHIRTSYRFGLCAHKSSVKCFPEHSIYNHKANRTTASFYDEITQRNSSEVYGKYTWGLHTEFYAIIIALNIIITIAYGAYGTYNRSENSKKHPGWLHIFSHLAIVTSNVSRGLFTTDLINNIEQASDIRH